jgi:hypothetical protein
MGGSGRDERTISKGPIDPLPHALAKDKKEAMHAGCDAVVITPYDVGALMEQIQRVAAQHTSPAHAYESFES